MKGKLTQVRRFSRVSLELLLVALCLGLSSVWSQNRPAVKPYRNDPQLREGLRSVVRSAAESTVEVLVEGRQVALGTVVGADGYILTKASEVKGPARVRLADGRELEAQIVGKDEAYDLLLLRVNASKLKPVRWGSGDDTPAGSFVLAPKPDGTLASLGVVSVPARDIPAKGPGSYPNPNIGYLGISLQDSQDGPVITSVMEGSPAEKAGLQRGDVIYTFAGQRVRNTERFLEMLRDYAPGTTVSLVVLRDEEFVEKRILLGTRPRDFSRAEFQNRLGGELSEKRSGFPRVLQHDATLLPRDCGGPLVNLDGEVIGINIARAGRTESYAIPSEAVQKLLPDLMRGKGLTPARK
ncbi:MAG: PDZ domain-containing protein [Gemmatales bacterium]|nr:PDZ domain-containing protein [Gemmatales bacterium]